LQRDILREISHLLNNSSKYDTDLQQHAYNYRVAKNRLQIKFGMPRKQLGNYSETLSLFRNLSLATFKYIYI